METLEKQYTGEIVDIPEADSITIETPAGFTLTSYAEDKEAGTSDIGFIFEDREHLVLAYSGILNFLALIQRHIRVAPKCATNGKIIFPWENGNIPQE